MKGKQLLVVIGIWIGIGFASVAYSLNPLDLWHSQLYLSNLQNGKYQRWISSHLTPSWKVKEYSVSNKITDSVRVNLLEELDWMTEVNGFNPYLKDYFLIYQKENKSIAIRKPGYTDKTILKIQTWRYTPNTGRIKKAHAIYDRDNWLYREHREIWVLFDDKGFYYGHVFHTLTDIKWMDGFVNLVIAGKWVRS
jgi:hypothetical protein